MSITPSQTAFFGPSDDAPVAAYVDALFGLAVKRRASEIHLEPQKQGLTIRLRVDGLLHYAPSPPSEIAHRLCARIKVMAAMDIAERRLPQDGRFTTNSTGSPVDLRVSSLPTLWGEKLVLRLVPDDNSILALADLGLSDDQQVDVLNALSKPQGLILVTGPTGSGKTLTLYSALQYLNQPHRNISTAEEPIEIPMTGINQIGIKPRIGLGFAETLRALLRQDPDVLMVGDALAKHPDTFDNGYLALIRSGEAAGELGPVLTTLADSYERAQQIRQSFVQPGLILATAAGATWMLLAFVMPEFAVMFAQQKRSLPAFTQWVIQLSETIEHQGAWWLLGVFLSLVMGFWVYCRSKFARLLLDGIVLRAPVVGNLSRCANTASMCRTLGATVGAGVAINNALPFAADACSNLAFQYTVKRLVSQLKNGARLQDAVAAEPCFPMTLQRMIRLGEESGKLEHMLQQATSFHEDKVRRTVSNLLPLIEPLLMVLLGFVVGGLILAMYLPIFAMGDLFHS